jgi:hypothetical protein
MEDGTEATERPRTEPSPASSVQPGSNEPIVQPSADPSTSSSLPDAGLPAGLLTAKKARRAAPKKAKEEVKVSAPVDLEACLTEVSQVITRLFRGRDEDRRELYERCARTEKENERLHFEVAELRARAEELAAQVERARRSESDMAERARQLEARLADRDEAARRAMERTQQLERELQDVWNEIGQTERRAHDDVHKANMLKEQAEMALRYQIRQRVVPFLSEAIGDGDGPAELTPEQERLRHRLRQILDALRELGVEPD